jgi:hypothetical protein
VESGVSVNCLVRFDVFTPEHWKMIQRGVTPPNSQEYGTKDVATFCWIMLDPIISQQTSGWEALASTSSLL